MNTEKGDIGELGISVGNHSDEDIDVDFMLDEDKDSDKDYIPDEDEHIHRAK